MNPNIFRTLVYSELWHILKPWCSEPCQIYTIKYFIQNPLQLLHIWTPDKFKTLA